MDLKASRLYPQATLMLQLIAAVSTEASFALKGGTAINLFWRELPRLSVDIDLTYISLETRQDATDNIIAALQRISTQIKKILPGVQVKNLPNPAIPKIIVQRHGIQVKIEPNMILRGTVFPCEQKSLSEKAEQFFELSAEIATLSFSELYAGKICAALDRQHPRDLFDIKILFENEGMTDQIVQAFLVYLASHSRPMNELLLPNLKDIHESFERDFSGMTELPIEPEALIEVRDRLVKIIRQKLTEKQKTFLISMKNGEPEWDLLGLPGIDRLPALQWKLQNIRKMTPSKKNIEINKLKEALA